MIKLKTTPGRSALMQRVRQRGTSPELALQVILRRKGYRFKTTGAHLPGSPDIYDDRTKRAIFVHGCFWHHHVRCKAATSPRRNAGFWRAKFEENVKRDRRKREQLNRLGYRVLTVWSCQLKEPTKRARLEIRLQHFFTDT